MSRTKHHGKIPSRWFEELWGNLDLHNMFGKMYRGIGGCGHKNKQRYHQKIRAKQKQELKKKEIQDDLA